MKISKFLKNPTVKLLLYIFENGHMRHRDLNMVIESRGTLSVSLNELIHDGLVQRLVKTDKKPIESYYFLTEKGEKVAYIIKSLIEIFEHI